MAEPCQTKDLGLRRYILLWLILIWLWVTSSLKGLLRPENLVITDSEDQSDINLCCVTLDNFLSLVQGRKICILDLSFLRTKTHHKPKESKWAFNSNRKRMLCVFSVLADPHGARKFVSLEARQEWNPNSPDKSERFQPSFVAER